MRLPKIFPRDTGTQFAVLFCTKLSGGEEIMEQVQERVQIAAYLAAVFSATLAVVFLAQV